MLSYGDSAVFISPIKASVQDESKEIKINLQLSLKSVNFFQR